MLGHTFSYRMFPMKMLDAILLFEQTNIIIKGVKQVGELVATTCDDNMVS